MHVTPSSGISNRISLNMSKMNTNNTKKNQMQPRTEPMLKETNGAYKKE